MSFIPIVIAAIAAVIGAVLIAMHNSALANARAMTATPTTPTGSLAGVAAGMQVEVKGKIRAASPLVAAFCGRPVVYHQSRVLEKQSRSASGGGTESRKVMAFEETRHAAATIDDGSGAVAIDLTGATVEAEQTVDLSHAKASSLGIDTARLTIGSHAYGYDQSEGVIADGAAVYVLATVREGGMLGAAAAGSPNIFIVSIRTEEERVAEQLENATTLRSIAWGLFAVGAIALVIGYLAG